MKLTRLRQKHSFNEEGFTLIEVIIALGVVAIGILSLMALQLNTIKGNAFANTMTRATYTGSDVIELLLAMPYNNPVYAVNGGNQHTGAELATVALAPGVTGVTWVVSNGAIANTKNIAVDVAYRDKSAGKHLFLNFSRGKLL